MADDPTSRRRFLGVAGSALFASVAGCTLPGSRSPGARSAGDTPDESTDPPNAADAVERGAYATVYEQTIDSVVLIRAYTTAGTGTGSGFVYREGGYLVTNQHVVANARKIEVRFSRGDWRTGEVLGTDYYSDIAVVKVADPPEYVEPLSLVQSDPPIGTQVVAIGNPYGLEKTVSAGIVSGVNRSIDVGGPRGGFQIPDAVQTDAAVNPGNSGGPLVTLDGRVVGIIRSGGGDNIGFAVSAALIRRVAPALIARGDYDHSYLGIALEAVSPTMAEANGLDEVRGVMVMAVRNGGPADGVLQPATGTRIVDRVRVPVGGDVIVALDDRRIETSNDLSTYLALETSPGDTIEVTVLRNGSRKTVELTLGSRPDPSGV